MKNIIALFPGQGSQKIGMGQEFYENSPVAKNMFSAADEALGFKLSKICFSGSEDALTLTQNVQPAILTVSCIAYSLFKTQFPDFKPIAGAGHSLGEYSALVAAGAISFEDAVLLVHKRGRYMQSAVPVGEGKMLAVLGKEETEVEKLLNDEVEVANVNAPGQIVISGTAVGVDSFKEENSSLKLIELPVSAPFHCKLMKSAADNLAVDLDEINISPAQFPIISNFEAKDLTEPEEIRQALKDQVMGKVRWVESMKCAVSKFGISKGLEFGNGKVLSGLFRRIDKSVNCKNIGSLSDIENYE